MSRQDTEPQVLIARPAVGDEPGPVGYLVPASVYLAAWRQAIRQEKHERIEAKLTHSWNVWEQERRRGDFLYALNMYVVPRPRTYADRKWLEGYCEACVTIGRILPIFGVVRYTITSLRTGMQKGPVTAILSGHIDAWLDSVGC